jgi:hypothetical protein
MRKPTLITRLVSGVAFSLLLLAVGTAIYGGDPYGVSPSGGRQWTLTFDDEFTHAGSINTNKWNAGAGGTDWCSLNFHGKSGGGCMFRENRDPCGQHYDGCNLSRANDLEMRSPGTPSAALQSDWRDDGSGSYGSVQFRLDGKPLWTPYTLGSKGTNMAAGISMFLLLDNDQMGGSPTSAFLVQYVRVWRLDPSGHSGSSSSNSNGGAGATKGKGGSP